MRVVAPLKTFALLPVVISVLIAQSDANKLLGRWRAAEPSSNGRTAFFEFHDGNRLDYISGQAIDGHYRMIDSKTMGVSTPEHDEEMEEITWNGTDQVTIGNKSVNQSIVLTRSGKMTDPEHPIVGDWTGERIIDGNKVEALYVFYSDNRNLWVLKLKTAPGTYTISGDSIKLEVPDHPVTEGSFAIDGDTLSLPGPGGNGALQFNRY